MNLEPGDVVGGYRIVRQLGSGGMGTVYEAEHAGLGVRYALKAFTRERGDVESLRRRFLAEAKTLARLMHPNIVRVYDVGEDAERGLLYFAMDLVVGSDGAARTLADVEPGEADEGRLAEWYGQLRSALEYIHAQGVVHRDFKPGNVLLDAKGNAVLGDFGISRFLAGGLRDEIGVESTVEIERTDERAIMGSVMYLAPEVRRGEKATPASDAYALGVTFYRLLTGIWYEPGPVADGLLAEFGREWQSALRRLLSDDPSKRIPIPAIAPSRATGRRRMILWSAAALAAAMIAAAAAVGFALRGRASSSEPSAASSAAPEKSVPSPRPSRSYTFDDFFPSHVHQK